MAARVEKQFIVSNSTELTFHGEFDSASMEFSEALGLSLGRAELYIGDAVVAAYKDGGWLVGSLSVPRITCDGPISIRLRDDGRQLGPFTDVQIGPDTIACAEGLIAAYNRYTKRWHFKLETRAA